MVGFQLGRAASNASISGEFLQRKAYIVESGKQSPGGVIVNRERHHHRSGGDISILKIHSDFQARILLDQFPQQFDIILGDFGGQQPALPALPRKISANRDEITTRNP